MNPVILVSCGTQTDPMGTVYVQKAYYAKCINQCGGIPIIDTGYGGEELAERCDGLILSGGGDIHPRFFGEDIYNDTVKIDDARDARELGLLKLFIDRRKPVLGICRGIQIINVYYGGTLFQDVDSQLGSCHTNKKHTVVTHEGSFLRKCFGEQFLVNSYHHQSIRTVGKGLAVTAVSDADGVIEGLNHEIDFVSGVQWHPERMCEGICRDTSVEMRPLFERFVSDCKIYSR